MKQEYKNNIQYYIPERITKLLAENKSRLHRNEKLRGGILFFDLVKFTSLTVSLAESGPRGAEKLHELMTQYYDLMINIIHRHGGAIYQFAGDSAIAAFEEQDDGEQETILNLCACALEMKQALQDSNIQYKEHKFSTKFSISYGEYHQVLLGDDVSHFQVALLGSAIDRVIQAEVSANADEIILTPEIALAIQEYAEISWRKNTAQLIKLNKVMILEHFNPNIVIENEDVFLKKCSRFVSPVLVDKIKASQQNYIGEFRDVTSVFIQVEGIDFSGEMKSIELLNDIYKKIRELGELFGGVLIQSDFSDKGSIFLVLFGAPVALEKKEIMAVRFALRQLELGKQFSQILKLNLAIATGPLYCGDVGSQIRKGYSVLGESVNLASRLMPFSEGRFPAIDQKTAKSLPETFVLNKLTELQLKGIEDSVSIYLVTSEKKEQKEKADQSALVGRKKELSWLKACLSETTVDGIAIGIIGDAGVGKSRLVFDFLKYTKDIGFEIYSGICYSYEKFTPYFPWKSIFSKLFQVHDELTAEVALWQIEAALISLDTSESENAIKAWAMVFYRLMGGSGEESEYTKNIEPKKKNEQIFDFTEKIVAQKAQQSKTLLLFDDYHWIDEGSENLIRHILAKKIPGLIILLVSRPEGAIYHLDANEKYRRLDLKEFSNEDASEYLHLKMNLKHRDRESEKLENEILNRAYGNPFFLESIVYSLREQGILIKQNEGTYEISRENKNIEIPDSLQGVLLSRIDRLGESEKLILKNASVIGRLFAYTLLKQIAPKEMEAALPSYLSALEANDFTVLETSDPLSYLFKHVLIRDAAYNSLLSATRETLHNRLAMYLEDLGEEKIQENIDQMAFHFFHAKNKAKAIEYSLIAARNAASSYSTSDAIYHYGNILQLIEGTNAFADLLYDVKIELGHVYRQAGYFAEAIDIFQEPLTMVKDRERQARIHTGIGKAYQEQGQIDMAVHEFEVALGYLGAKVPKSKQLAILGILKELFKRGLYSLSTFLPLKIHGNKKLNYEMRYEILESIGKIYFFIDVEKFAWATLSHVSIADKINIRRHQGRSYGALGLIYGTLALYNLADKSIKKAKKYANDLNDPLVEAWIWGRQGSIGMYRNQPNFWYECMCKARQLAERLGETWEKVLTHGLITVSLMYMGKIKEANDNNKIVDDMSKAENTKQFLGWALSTTGFLEYILNKKSCDECIEILSKSNEISLSAKDTASFMATSRFMLTILVSEKRTREAVAHSKDFFAGLNAYSSIIAHAHCGYYNIIEAIELATNENLISKKEADKIWKTSLIKLKKMGKKYFYITGFALRAEARTYVRNGNIRTSQIKITEAVKWYEKSENLYERVLTYYDAAVLVPEKRNEYIDKGIALCRENEYGRDLIRFQKLRESE